jgi:TRAP-type C4-dicarboxylate transport system permease small subunit
MVWFCLLSPPEALREDRHLCITVFQQMLPGAVMKAVDFINHVLILAFAAFMVIEGTKLTGLTSRNILPGMGVPASILYSSIPSPGHCSPWHPWSGSSP